MTESRKDFRKLLDTPVSIITNNKIIKAEMQNISLGGMLLITPEELPLTQVIKISFYQNRLNFGICFPETRSWAGH